MSMLVLAGCTPIGAGTMRFVYAHPHNPDALVKVIRSDMLQSRWGGRKHWLKRRARARQFTVYLREIKEYVALRARDPLAAPITRVLGLVETDQGLGMVVESVRGRDGGLAPTLADLYARDGYLPWMREAMDALFDELIRCGVVLSDSHPCNFVYGSTGDEPPRFVMVDGFGEKNVLPLCSISARYNARNTRRLHRRMLSQLFALPSAASPGAASP
jgi:hypothetical protein